MNTDYGFAEIFAHDKSYLLRPTLINISKIGTPKQIIECFDDLAYRNIHLVKSFITALKILNCCGIKDGWLTGCVTFSEWQNRMVVMQGKMSITEVFIIAEHCLIHGVCGKIDETEVDSDKTGSPLLEFDPHMYISDCMEFLGMTLREAEEITMTQFVKLVRAKNKSLDARKNGNPNYSPASEAQANKDAMEMYEELNRREMASNKVQKISQTNEERLAEIMAKDAAKREASKK